MTAKQALLYSKDKFKTISDAWSHTIHLISYPCYNPKDYKIKSFSEEMEELFIVYYKRMITRKNFMQKMVYMENCEVYSLALDFSHKTNAIYATSFIFANISRKFVFLKRNGLCEVCF